jgi:hypothetical protein
MSATDQLVNGGTATVLDLSHRLKGTGLRGIIAVDKGDTNVTLQGSLDGTNFFVIEEFTADTIKEITLCPYLRVNGAADTSNNDTIGSSTAFVYYNNGAYTK